MDVEGDMVVWVRALPVPNSFFAFLLKFLQVFGGQNSWRQISRGKNSYDENSCYQNSRVEISVDKIPVDKIPAYKIPVYRNSTMRYPV